MLGLCMDAVSTKYVRIIGRKDVLTSNKPGPYPRTSPMRTARTDCYPELRGLTRGSGASSMTAAGEADIAQAKSLLPSIAESATHYGILP
jgi:hypothetical protein